ncbi:MAG TPA: acyltransferase family protein [Anaerolineales bacterium]|nr:acyltransferase family protein [Anaerolineales bacterium]HMV96486.1 acyltransferase family protein [Anaerolineales bacterium]HMZ44032.1 acyltransferase family protein [Anaerolineales bacterium]HNB87617.1 acyltransferase family protein [Anaerolineales bacterium]HND92759.1 acyltransferase family protein [Anaerolineales bacterium]
MNTTSSSVTLRWVDLIRVIGAFLVVMAHVAYTGAGPVLASTYYFVISRVAVPLFFMVSGFLLLKKEEPYGVFFRKRAVKVAVPFLVWSVIYLLWKREGFETGFSLDLVVSYVVKIVRGPRENHLWFFYALIGLYLFTPILRVFVARASKTDLFYFCGLWFLVVPIFSLLQEFTPIKIGFELYFVAGYTGYFLLGHVLGLFEFSRKQLYGLAVLFLFLSVLTAYLDLQSNLLKWNTQYFVSYLSVNIVLLTVAAFILLREIPIDDRWYAFLAPLGRASFGIYLVHVIVLTELEKIPAIHYWFSAGSSVYMIPLLGLFGFAVSYLIVAVVQKIPVLRWAMP